VCNLILHFFNNLSIWRYLICNFSNLFFCFTFLGIFSKFLLLLCKKLLEFSKFGFLWWIIFIYKRSPSHRVAPPKTSCHCSALSPCTLPLSQAEFLLWLWLIFRKHIWILRWNITLSVWLIFTVFSIFRWFLRTFVLVWLCEPSFSFKRKSFLFCLFLCK